MFLVLFSDFADMFSKRVHIYLFFGHVPRM